VTPKSDGPSLEQYVETRFNLLLKRIKEAQRAVEKRNKAERKALDFRFAALKEANLTALAAADRAVSKAELATEKRFESVNEFRGTLDQQQRTLIPRSEVDVLVRGLDEKIGNLTKQMDQLQAERMGIKGGWGYAAGLAGLVLTLFSLFMVLWKFKG